jgi:Acyl-CoA reductase (LuxC)
MVSLSDRVSSLVLLGHFLRDLSVAEIVSVCERAEIENPWFTQDNIKKSLNAIRDQFLNQEALHQLIDTYKLDDNIPPKKIGLILAGNIPLVGFHDVLCCYLTGHISLIKYSDKDKVLLQFLIKKLIEINVNNANYFLEVSKLVAYDAAIVTGSNTTAKHFEYYFGHVPHIIRKNRNSVAILTGYETDEELQALGSDVFSYFGLGCRNVSKIFVPMDYDITRLFEIFESHKEVIFHNKYKNNYDYNVALLLLNKEKFLHNDMLILRASDQIISRIGSLHYEYYDHIENLTTMIGTHKDEIQCVVSNAQIPGVEIVPFGAAQLPTILTYSDGVDTIQFLLSL